MAEKEPPPTPKSKLETLSKEDLIRFAKKQAITSKQLREKNDELEAKLKAQSISPSRQLCDASIQTASTEERQLLCRLQEENQWLRMALSTREDVDEGRRTGSDQISVSKIDDCSQTLPLPDVASYGKTIDHQLISVECQTEEELNQRKAAPAVDPDALREAKMQLQLLASELDEARRQLTGQSLLKLEMEDTERSFAKLQAELRQSSSLLGSTQNENASLTAEVQTLQKRLANAEQERERSDKKTVEAESLIEATRKELNANKLELYNVETKLTKTVEELEKMKLETASDVSVTQQRLCDLESAFDETRRRLEKSENERTNVERQLDEVNSEFRAYKTRVHSVLKQERRSTSTNAEGEDDAVSGQLRSAERQLANSLREQLEKTKQLYETCRCDLERVREQHDQLYDRHRILRTHADEAEAQWKCELEALRTDASRISRLHAEQIRALTAEKRDMQRDFERKTDDLLREGKMRTETLEQRVEDLERDLDRARQQLLDNERKAKKSDRDQDSKDESRRKQGNESVDFAMSTRPLAERRPGEGAENADALKKTAAGFPMEVMDSGFDRQRSLEDLLGDEQSVHSFEVSTDRPLKDDSAAATAKLRHLTELLSESEANTSRLSEQIKLLKDEIRRLERNNERSEHIANAEYLKNIVLQFLNPSMHDRRQRLMPVLTTLLRLSPDEVATLNGVVSENQAPPTASTNSSGWSGYIHRWSGFN